jgi:hypothetical protein
MSNVGRIAAQAANSLTTPLNVEEVFSTYLYDGTGSTQTITNGIDLDGEGGAILTKRRDSSTGGGPWFNDTERGITKYISTSATSAETDSSSSISAVTSSGYTLGTFTGWNNSAGEYASWTFRKAPKFFDVVTYTGTGSAQNISHNLGSVPGCIITKRTDASENWLTYHRGLDATAPEDKYVMLNKTNAVQDASTIWNDTAPTSTQFTVGSANTNTSGGTYVAYLFAHNDGDGDFGPDGDADIIKCGSYTGNDGTQDIDLGFEPAWVLVKSSSNARDWKIIDNMRGFAASPNNKWLTPNSSNAEENINASASTIQHSF